MPNFRWDNNSHLNSHFRPSCWRAFVREWKISRSNEIQTNWETNSTLFMFSCPAWLRSSFFLCTHLISETPCPGYRQVTIWRSSPFFEIDVDSSRVRANVDDEEFTNEKNNDYIFQTLDTATALRELSQSYEDEMAVARDDFEDVRDLSAWLLSHVDEYRKDPASAQQVSDFRWFCLPRLQLYRHNVGKYLKAQTTTRTWSHLNIALFP